MAAISAFEELHQLDVSASEPTGALDEIELDAPVPAPRNCFGIGLNYKSHVAEASMDLPQTPVVFTKFPSCIAAPDTDVALAGDAIDYEAELVVVIGRGGRDIAAVGRMEPHRGGHRRPGHLRPRAAVRRKPAALRSRQVARLLRSCRPGHRLTGLLR